MKLNCRPGQLAIKVKGRPTGGNPIGTIVTCLSYRTIPWVDSNTGEWQTHGVWYVELRGSNVCLLTGLPFVCEDEFLRPIRDTDGEDETLSWADVPKPLVSTTQKETTCPL